MKTMKNFLMTIAIIACTTLCLFSCTSKDQLKIAVEIAAAQCPMDCGDGITMKDILLENGNVVYVYEMDEDYYDIEECKDPLTIKEMKEALMDEILHSNDNDIKEFLKIVKDSEADIIYRYIGDTTGKKIDIVIDNSEL